MFGRYRYLRMTYCISSGSEVYQQAIESLMYGTPCKVMVDDILVYGTICKPENPFQTASKYQPTFECKQIQVPYSQSEICR